MGWEGRCDHFDVPKCPWEGWEVSKKWCPSGAGVEKSKKKFFSFLGSKSYLNV